MRDSVIPAKAEILQKETYSSNQFRNQIYLSFLAAGCNQAITLDELVKVGTQLMRSAKLHPHFFKGRSLRANALGLAFHVLGFPPDYQNEKYLNAKISESEAEKIICLFERRIVERLPLEYLTQEAHYFGNSFYVNEQVLVPRSLMGTRFKEFLKKIQWTNYRVLDLCTGSGCIGITLALLEPRLRVDLADVSSEALAVAAFNVKKHALTDRLRCIQGNLFENITEHYDLIISNPPYVPDKEYQPQPQEVKNEPALALKGGKDGLDIIYRILRQAKNHLNPQGCLIMEVGYGPAKRLKKLYPNLPFQWFVSRSPWWGDGELAEQEPLWEKCLNKLFGTHSILLYRAED